MDFSGLSMDGGAFCKQMKKFCFIWLFFVPLVAISSQQIQGPAEDSSVFALTVLPGIGLPLGADAELYGFGTGADISANFALGVSSPFRITGNLGYGLVTFSDSSVSIINLGAGGGFRFVITPSFSVGLIVSGGVFFGLLNGAYDSYNRNVGMGLAFGDNLGGFLITGTDAELRLSESLGLTAAVTYRGYFGLYSGIQASIGTSIHAQPKKSALEQLMDIRPEPLQNLELEEPVFTDIFPVLYKYYDSHPIGSVGLQNNEDLPLENLEISFFIKQFMDNPKAGIMPDRLEEGQRSEIEIYGLFSNSVLEITERTVVSALIVVKGTMDGRAFENEYVKSVNIYDRNSITWEDDRRAAAFVTLKDPTVLRFAKNVAGTIKEKSDNALDANLLAGIAMHEAVTMYGVNYVIDPSSPYIELSEQKQTADYLQFPKQTLEYKAGDCDDLSILYTALLESIGVHTAFITIPGHIYTAFALKSTPGEAAKKFANPDDLIFKDDKVYVPVEITEIGGGFMRAWQTGAKQWREYEGERGFYPVPEAWKVYEPVGIASQADDLDPLSENFLSVYLDEVKKIVQREIYDRVAVLKQRIIDTSGNPKMRNKLAILFAQYGLNEEAKGELDIILEQRDYLPALLNMANILFLEKQMEQSLVYYGRAAALSPEYPIVLLGLARTNHEMENYGTSRKIFDKLKISNPELAAKYGYLELKGDEANRAAEIGETRSRVEWEEESE